MISSNITSLLHLYLTLYSKSNVFVSHSNRIAGRAGIFASMTRCCSQDLQCTYNTMKQLQLNNLLQHRFRNISNSWNMQLLVEVCLIFTCGQHTVTAPSSTQLHPVLVPADDRLWTARGMTWQHDRGHFNSRNTADIIFNYRRSWKK